MDNNEGLEIGEMSWKIDGVFKIKCNLLTLDLSLYFLEILYVYFLGDSLFHQGYNSNKKRGKLY